MRRFRWAIVLAIGIVVGAACIGDDREPWMTLEIDGHEYEGLLISYCWRSFPPGVCADGFLREPPMHMVRAAGQVVVRARTRAGIRDLHVAVAPTLSELHPAQVDPATAGPLVLDVGAHYVSVGAWWDRGNGSFLFGLRIERP